MKITIKGGNKRYREVIEDMLPWLGKKLFPRIHKDVQLEIDIKNISKYLASTCPNGDYLKSTRPRIFEIELHNRIKIRQLRLVLIHELVHVKQYASGKLFDYDRGVTRYLDKFYDTSAISDTDYDEYWMAPFEIEARGMEEGLLALYRKWKRQKRH